VPLAPVAIDLLELLAGQLGDPRVAAAERELAGALVAAGRFAARERPAFGDPAASALTLAIAERCGGGAPGGVVAAAEARVGDLAAHGAALGV